MKRHRFCRVRLRRALPMFLRVIAVLTVAVSLSRPSDAESGKLLQVGFFGPVWRGAATNPWLDAFSEGLRSRGYIEGQNVHVQYRFASEPEDIPAAAAELVGRKVDVIATVGPPQIEALRRTTDAVPIVILECDRADRIVAKIARPGGNITGMACTSSDLAAKRLQLLQEVSPGLSRVAVLYNASTPSKVVELGDIQAAATKLAIAVQPVAVRDPQGFETAFATIQAGDAQALLSMADPLMMNHRHEIADFALRHRLPSMYPFSHYVREGGLMSYGSDLIAAYHRYGYFIDKIAKGAKAGDIPIEEPTKFELIINLRTAKMLGIEMPSSLLVQANEVIE